MSGLQTIIDRCNGIKFNRRNVVGIQYTRNEIPRVSQTPTKNPWKITVDMPSSFKYNEARSLMEELDTLDTTTPQLVTFGNNANLQWIWAYQGSLTTTQLNGLNVVSYVGETLTLNGLPTVAATTVMFKKNDLIQVNTHPFPFTSTTDVLRGTGSTGSTATRVPSSAGRTSKVHHQRRGHRYSRVGHRPSPPRGRRFGGVRGRSSPTRSSRTPSGSGRQRSRHATSFRRSSRRISSEACWSW
jgi:hypothetical protein